jgi:hypothetical protein
MGHELMCKQINQRPLITITNYSSISKFQKISIYIGKLIFESTNPTQNDVSRPVEISIFESKLSVFKVLAQTLFQIGPFRENHEHLFAETKLNQDQIFSSSHNGEL